MESRDGPLCRPIARGYSVLTHGAIIDATWKDNIVPLLLKRFDTGELTKPGAYRLADDTYAKLWEGWMASQSQSSCVPIF